MQGRFDRFAGNSAAQSAILPAPGYSSLTLVPSLGKPQVYIFKIGMTVADIANDAHRDTRHLVAELWDGEGWTYLAREWWAHVKPKRENAVRFIYRLQGGGDGGRTLFAIAATIALAAVAGPLGAALGSSFGTSAAIGSAIVTTLGSLAIAYASSALFPASVAGPRGKAEADLASFENVESDQNVQPKNGYLPWVAGERRISLPEVMPPHSSLKDGNQQIERCFAWYGDHGCTDIEVDGTPITDFPKITTQIRDGNLSTPVETFITKYARPININQELKGFTLSETDLEDQAVPENAEPVAIQFATEYRRKLNEIAIRLDITAMMTSDSATQQVALPLRIYMRQKGETTWNGVCEWHIIGREPGSVQRDIRFNWTGVFDEAEDEADIEGALQSRIFSRVPAADVTLSDGTTGDQFTAHADFTAGPGLEESIAIRSRRSGLRITLKTASFPKGEYEFKIIRGLMTDASQIDANYEISGSVYSLFHGYDSSGVWKVPVDQGKYPTQIKAPLAKAVFAEAPVQKPGTGVLALRSFQSVRNVTAKLAKRVNRWNGSTWSDYGTSKNPADQYFARLEHGVSQEIISASVIKNISLQNWWQEGDDRDYQVNAIFNGLSLGEQLQKIASAGFARVNYDEGYGVDHYRDRSSENVKTTFTPRNSEISFGKRTIERPESWRCKFADETNSYKEHPGLNVLSPFPSTYSGQEAVTFDNITREIDVRRRVLFDDFNRQYRDIECIIKGSIEAEKLQIGDLIGVATDLLGDYSHGFRIRQVIDDLHIAVDQVIPAIGTNDIYGTSDIYSVANIYALGGKSVCYFNVNNPADVTQFTDSRYVVGMADNVLTLDSPMTVRPVEGQHITVTPEKNSRFRFLAEKIIHQPDNQAEIIAVPEAPQIYQKMLEIK